VGNADYKKRNQEKGLCKYCPTPVYPPYTLCLNHLEKDNERKKRFHKRNRERLNAKHRELRKKWKDEGKCIRCGNDLDEDIDYERVKCQNCREGICYE